MRFVLTISVAVGAVIMGGTGCRDGPSEGRPETILPQLEQAFGIRFPTNAHDVKAASWDYRGVLDGDSKNKECVARLQLGRAEFLAWRTSVTNLMREYQQFTPRVEPRMEKKLEWWDLRKFPRDRFTHYFHEIDRSPNDYKRLEIYSLDLGATNITYISALLLKR
jgi:hypothetical protein